MWLSLLILKLLFIGALASMHYPFSRFSINKPVSGGIEVKSHLWPWVADILIKYHEDEEEGPSCTGAYVGERWIVTAAHCFYLEGVLVRNVAQLEIFLGSPTYKEGIEFEVENLYPHPKYNLITKENDVGLIRLSHTDEVYDTPGVKLAMPHHTEDYLMGKKLILVGYGDNSQKNEEFPLFKTTPYVLPHKECEIRFKDQYSRKMEYCVGDRKDRTMYGCRGDSGGPVLFQEKNKDLHIIGIISGGVEGLECGMKGGVNIIVRVLNHRGWIDKMMNDARKWEAENADDD